MNKKEFYMAYPENWFSEIRPRILERDGHRCVTCKRAAGDPLPKKCCDKPRYNSKDRCRKCGKLRSRVVLTVAHLDHDISNNDDSNLSTLCRGCHVSYDAKHHAENARRTRASKQAKRERLAAA